LVERILETGLALERKLQSGLRTIPANRVATVRYEDLLSEPSRSIEILRERLAIGDPSALRAKVGEYMARNPPRATRSAHEWRPLVQVRWREMFDDWGYPRL